MCEDTIIISEREREGERERERGRERERQREREREREKSLGMETRGGGVFHISLTLHSLISTLN